MRSCLFTLALGMAQLQLSSCADWGQGLSSTPPDLGSTVHTLVTCNFAWTDHVRKYEVSGTPWLCPHVLWDFPLQPTSLSDLLPLTGTSAVMRQPAPLADSWFSALLMLPMKASFLARDFPMRGIDPFISTRNPLCGAESLLRQGCPKPVTAVQL